MSDCSPEPVLESAKDIRARAVAWFERRQFWDWSEADHAEFDAWISQSLAHRAAYVRVESLWSRADRIAALRASTEVRDGRSGKLRLVPWGRRALFGVLTLVFAGVAGMSTWLYLSAPHKQMFETSVGGHEIVTLSDGSQIELNTNTTLQALIGAGKREVWLDKGEAYFQIIHDRARPFVVVAGNDRMTDLGTKFVVRREPDRLQVAVMEGRVRLDAARGALQRRPVSLGQGDVAIATADAMPVFRKSDSEMTNALSWRKGILVFENTKLVDAAVEFNRYNSVQIVVADRAAAGAVIGGKFPATDIAAFTELAQHVLGLRVAKSGNEIVISR